MNSVSFLIKIVCLSSMATQFRLNIPFPHIIHMQMSHFVPDSPGIPPSATAHELFRGFSFVAPALLDENHEAPNPLDNQISLAKVSCHLWLYLSLIALPETRYKIQDTISLLENP